MKLTDALIKARLGDTDASCVYLADGDGPELMFHGPDSPMTVFPSHEDWVPTYNELISDKWEIPT